jgi:ligand-binding SRPBCC domain-containing protein
VPIFEKRSELAVPAIEIYRWHARPGAFWRLAPPWRRLEMLESTGGIGDGARLVMRIGRFPLAVRWVAVHRRHEQGKGFVDAQEFGPFSRWIHEHRFEELPSGRRAMS